MKKVIIVDDEAFILMILEDKLKSAGFKVLTRRNGQGIMELLKSEKPDLLIVDWMLPDTTGIDICRMIKNTLELSAVPVFMLTAKGQEADEKYAMESGAVKYITKPFSPKTLLNLVIETIGEAK
ncbi:MAG: response regulator [Nitrospirae bacterium]|nr:response regulator [Nitrospirota bacterium]